MHPGPLNGDGGSGIPKCLNHLLNIGVHRVGVVDNHTDERGMIRARGEFNLRESLAELLIQALEGGLGR